MISTKFYDFFFILVLNYQNLVCKKYRYFILKALKKVATPILVDFIEKLRAFLAPVTIKFANKT